MHEYTTIELKQTRFSLEHTGRERDMNYLHFCFDILSDLADEVLALITEDYLEARAARANKAEFDAAMSKVADIEPLERDEL